MNKTPKLLLATLALCPALLSFGTGSSKLAFSIEEGSTRTKTFTNVAELTLDDMLMLMNGEEGPMPEIEMTVESNLEIRVTDEYLAMGDGRPKKLKRSFDRLVQNTDVETETAMMGQIDSKDLAVPASSELEGEEVIFTWNAETGEYDVAFPEGEGDEDLLVGLDEDMDLRGFLPDGEVAEGDEWTVDPAVLSTVLVPGGNLKLLPEEAGDDAMPGMQSEMGDFAAWFSEDLEGEIRATFKGTRAAEGGAKVGVIGLVVEITNAVDMTEQAQEQLENGELPPGVDEMEISALDLQMKLETEGTLLWDLAAGCAHSFEMSGDFELSVDTTVNLSAQGMEMELETSVDLSGTLNTTATIE